MLGEDSVAKFYRESDLTEAGAPIELHLVRWIAGAIQRSCSWLPEKRFHVDGDRLLAELKLFADLVLVGRFDFKISLRLTNVDIRSDVLIDEGITFRRLSPEIVAQKYPLNREFMGVPGIVLPHWTKHCVEVVITRSGTLKQYEQLQRVEHTGDLVNSILHAFVLSGVCGDPRPHVTHVLRESPLGGGCLLYGAGGIGPSPKLLEADDIARVKAAFQFLKNVPSDPVLEVAVDRFMIGALAGTHHPNKVNQPNWDKIVDYVIALESIFLTTSGGTTNQELSYRFRLNGSSLIHEAVRNDRRVTFHALRHLYDLRSKVVHGDASAAVKSANKFIEVLNIDDPQHTHPIGRLKLVIDQVEEWLRQLLVYLGSIQRCERPYAKQDGWENLLWKTGAAEGVVS